MRPREIRLDKPARNAHILWIMQNLIHITAALPSLDLGTNRQMRGGNLVQG